MTKRARLWTYATGSLLLIMMFLASYYRDNRNYLCEGCFSRLARNQRRVGFWMGSSFPISPDTAEERDSYLYRDYRDQIGPQHEHDWVFAQGSPYGVFGWGGCALGRGYWGNSLQMAYELVPLFRIFVREKEAKGGLKRSDFVAACLLPRDPNDTERDSTEFQRLTKLGKALEEEFSHR